MFRFPSPSLSWWWVGRSGKTEKKRKNTGRVLSASEGRAAKYESLVTWSFRSYRNETTKCLKRLKEQSIDDNLIQLVLMREDRVLVN